MAGYRLTTISTRTGDDGCTRLGFGGRVPKDHARIEACGTVDELNSCLGVALAGGLDRELALMAARVQNGLFDLGADLTVTEPEKLQHKVTQITAQHISELEDFLAQLQKSLKPLENFILPGGAPGAAQLHVCRCVCRRAERDIVHLRTIEPIGQHVIAYVNRLSDLLFVMARYENLKRNVPDVLWQQK